MSSVVRWWYVALVALVGIVVSGCSILPPEESAPPVSLSCVGNLNDASEYINGVSVVAEANDGLGSETLNVTYRLDGGKATAYSGEIKVKGAGAHTVSATATDAAGNVSDERSITCTISSVPEPVIGIVSPDDEMLLGSRLVFSSANGAAVPERTLTVVNTGLADLSTSGLTITGADAAVFVLCAGQQAQFEIAPGQRADICVRYAPGTNTGMAAQVSRAVLSISSNDPVAPTKDVSLGGLNTLGYEDVREPSLREILAALGYSNQIPLDGRPNALTVSASSGAVGNEVVSAYWSALDPSKPVRLVPLARYQKPDHGVSYGYGLYAKGTKPSGGFDFSSNASNGGYGENQKLRPTPNEPNAVSFKMGSAFGYWDGDNHFSDDNLNVGGFHEVRFFPALGSDGKEIPGAYLIAVDTSAVTYPYKNWDFQDTVFLLSNAQPDGANDQPVPATLDRSLAFDGGGGGVNDTGFADTLGTFHQSAIHLRDGRLVVDVTPADAKGPVDALAMPVNPGLGTQVATRLNQPATWLREGGGGFVGVFYSPAAGVQVRGVVRRTDTTTWVISLERVDATGVTTLAERTLREPSFKNIDLHLIVQAQSVTGPNTSLYYSLDNGAWAPAGSAVSIPDEWIVEAARAGVTQDAGSGEGFAAMYESFDVRRDL